MVFNCKVFYVDEEEEALLTAVGNKKQQSDQVHPDFSTLPF